MTCIDTPHDNSFYGIICGMPKVKNSAIRSWITIALVAAVFYAMYRANPNPSQSRSLTQLELYNAINEGKITGPVVRHLNREDGETFLTGEMETDELDAKDDPVRTRFVVRLVPGENEHLMDDLLAANISVEVREHKSAISPFIMQTLFFVGMMGLMPSPPVPSMSM